MKIIARYALRNPKINTKCKIEPKGIIFCLEQTATGSATAVAARTEGFLADKAYHYICGEGIVYAIAQPTRFAAHSNGSADKNMIGIALVLPSPEARDEKSEFAKYRRSEAAVRTENVVKTAVLLAANLCRRFGLDPKADGVILTRKEAEQRGLAENGASPESVFETLGGKMSAKKTPRTDKQTARGLENKKLAFFRLRLNMFFKKYKSACEKFPQALSNSSQV